MGEGKVGRILWVSDACVATGFGRATHAILDRLAGTWDVHVLGLGYRGDPHPYAYDIHPASRDGDRWGLERLRQLTRTLRPDVVLAQHDPWVVAEYMAQLGRRRPRTAAWLPVDGRNFRPEWLRNTDLPIFYTQFGADQAQDAGHRGPAPVLGLGVDTQVYRPVAREEARARSGTAELFEGRFVVGAFNRNQRRKRIDLLMSYFADWVRYATVDPLLYLHMAPDDPEGWDLEQLADYLGITDRVILRPGHSVSEGVPDAELALLIAACDVGASTTQGEGFGLTALEGLACARAQVVPNWSAYGDWASEGTVLVPCSEIAVTPRGMNAVGGVPDRGLFVSALDRLARDAQECGALGERGRCLAAAPRFRWEWIARRMDRELQALVAGGKNVDTSGRAEQPAPAVIAGPAEARHAW